jgi:hypothetical protein
MLGDPVTLPEMQALLSSIDPDLLSAPARRAYDKLQAATVIQQPTAQHVADTARDFEVAVADTENNDHTARILQGHRRLLAAAPVRLPEADQLFLGTIYTALVARGLMCGALPQHAVEDPAGRPYSSEIFIALKAAWQVGYEQKTKMETREEPHG